MVKHDKTDEIICPDKTSFLQFVSDNTDQNLATLDGQNTVKVVKWLDVKANNGIKIVQYYTPNIPALTKIVL